MCGWQRFKVHNANHNLCSYFHRTHSRVVERDAELHAAIFKSKPTSALFVFIVEHEDTCDTRATRVHTCDNTQHNAQKRTAHARKYSERNRSTTISFCVYILFFVHGRRVVYFILLAIAISVGPRRGEPTPMRPGFHLVVHTRCAIFIGICCQIIHFGVLLGTGEMVGPAQR